MPTINYRAMAAAATHKRSRTPPVSHGRRGDGAAAGAASPTAAAAAGDAETLPPCVAQIFVQLEELREALPGGDATGPHRRKSSSSNVAPGSQEQHTQKTAKCQQSQPGSSGGDLAEEVLRYASSAPQILRITAADTAADVVERALAAFHRGAVEHLLAAARPRPTSAAGSSGGSSGTAQLPMAVAASSQQRHRSPPLSPSLGAGEVVEWHRVLPSRLREDYALFVASVDGSLPMPPVSGAAAGGLPVVPPLLSHADERRNSSTASTDGGTLAQRLIHPDERVRNHPKFTFPFTLRVAYAPVRCRARGTPNVLAALTAIAQPAEGMERDGEAAAAHEREKGVVGGDEDQDSATAEVPGGDGGGEKVNALPEPTMAALRRFNLLADISSPARALQVDDDVARAQGFTPLAFLSPVAAPAAASESAKTNEAAPGGVSSTISPQHGAEQQLRSRDASSPPRPPPPGVDDLDVPLDSFMRAAGLTLYDVAQHGRGSLALQCREGCRTEALRLTREEVTRRREANVVLAERRRERRERERLADCGVKACSAREEALALRRAAAERAARTSLEQARIDAAVAKERIAREMAMQKAVAETQARIAAELAEEQRRQKALEESVVVDVSRRELARLARTTLAGEAEAHERRAREAGPLTAQLQTRRPQLRRLDQAERQTRTHAALISSLESAAASSKSRCESALAVATEARRRAGAVADDAAVVTLHEAAALHDRQKRRSERHALAAQQLQHTAAVTADPRFVKLLRKPEAPYRERDELEPELRCAPASVVEQERARREQEEEGHFERTRAAQEAHQRAVVARRELGVPRRVRPVPDDPMPPQSPPSH